MNQNQLNSLVRSLLKIAGAIALAHGASKTAAIINCEDMVGLISLVIGLLLSWQWHRPAPVLRPPTSAPAPAPSAPVPSSVVRSPVVP